MPEETRGRALHLGQHGSEAKAAGRVGQPGWRTGRGKPERGPGGHQMHGRMWGHSASVWPGPCTAGAAPVQGRMGQALGLTGRWTPVPEPRLCPDQDASDRLHARDAQEEPQRVWGLRAEDGSRGDSDSLAPTPVPCRLAALGLTPKQVGRETGPQQAQEATWATSGTGPSPRPCSTTERQSRVL